MGRHRTDAEKEAFRERAVAMRRAGIGAKRIARELGIGGALASELLRGEPVPSSLVRPRAKDEVRDVAVSLRLAGRTYDEIRDELGVSKSSLSLWLRELTPPTEGQRARVRSGACDDQESDVPPDAEIARGLRREGWLLREIAAELGVSLRTAFVWCRGAAVPARAMHGRNPEQTRAMGRAYWDAELARRDVVRQATLRDHQAQVGSLSDRELDLVVAAAYWCEGSKSKPWARREQLQFINSDPDVIRLLWEWLRRRGVPVGQCRLSVHIHESADVQSATEHWARVLGCPAEAFARPVLKRHNPRTARKNTGAEYVGCLTIGVRQSVALYREVEGVWRAIAGEVGRRLASDEAD